MRVFHLDLDCFFVAVERLKNPALIGRPVAVGGSRTRGVISSASYEARRFGVRSAMPVVQALRVCPQLELVPSDFEAYRKASQQVFAILDRFSPVCEPVSVDEAYLDMTGTRLLFGEPQDAAAQMRAEIKKQTGLTCSVGIAANRLVAKIATDYCKPNGVHEVKEGDEAGFLSPLSVRKIPGVGAKTGDWLEQRGIRLVSDLQAFPSDALERQFGRMGNWLARAARGEGSTQFHEPAQNRSASRERTFSENVGSREVLEKKLWELCVDLSEELRKDGDWARSVKLKVRYANFETIVRQRVCEFPICTEEDFFPLVLRLLAETWEGERPVRLIGLGASLASDGNRQWNLFERPELTERREALAKTRDRVREKFGQQAIRTGREFD